MNYRVEWTAEAQNDLAAIWNAATDQAAVTTASDWLDQHLARDPRHFGEEWTSPTELPLAT